MNEYELFAELLPLIEDWPEMTEVIQAHLAEIAE